MSRLQKHWARGLKAGDLVYHQEFDREQMAEVLMIPQEATEGFDGQVPIAYIKDFKKRGIWVPADDIEILVAI
ncbi:MAG: hypothetical protein AAB455_01345 [Patescibacteria group bacterium]